MAEETVKNLFCSCGTGKMAKAVTPGGDVILFRISAPPDQPVTIKSIWCPSCGVLFSDESV